MEDLSFLDDPTEPPREINLWNTSLYSMELRKVEAMSPEELETEVKSWRSELALSDLDDFLGTRRKTGENLRVFPDKKDQWRVLEVLASQYAQVLFFVRQSRRKQREQKEREQIEAVKKKETVDEQTESLKAISSSWLKIAKENSRAAAVQDDDTRRRLPKVTVDKFMGQQQSLPHVQTVAKAPRKQKAKKDLCSRCGETTTYKEDGKVRRTNFILDIGGKRMKICRKCMKFANSHATGEKTLDNQHIDKKDQIVLKMSRGDLAVMNFAASTKKPEISKSDSKAEESAKGIGTEADPILLSSEDEEADDKQKKGATFTRAVVSQNQRKTRQSSKVETDPILDELKCSMPPAGGHGSVSFVLRDYFRLGPEEFLNDSCIDYYMKYLEQKLLDKNPEDAKRCYFFNSFFYKKLSDTSSETAISDETQALVGSVEGLDKLSLQALRCYDVTKSWTKKFDMFSKDFLFIPIHDQLHWSLIIVCHPGAQIKMPTCNVKEVKNHEEAFMIHLDSLRPPGGHGSDKIAKLIKRYLQNEWTAKLKQEGDNVPKAWTEKNPDTPRNFLSMKVRRPALPMQDNYYDCGCFVCAFADHFLAHLPARINAQMVPTGRGRDLFKGSRKPIYAKMPTFLSKNWFQSENASHLRHHLARMVLKAMAVNAGVMDDYGRWNLGNLSTDDNHKATFLMNKLENLENEGEYTPPSWEDLPEASEEESDDVEICLEKTSEKASPTKTSSSEDAIEESPSMSDDQNVLTVRTKNTNVIMSDDDQELDIIHPDLTEDKINVEMKETTPPIFHSSNILKDLRRKRQLRNTPDVSLVSVSTPDDDAIEIAESPKKSKSKNVFARKKTKRFPNAKKLAEISEPFRNKLRKGIARLPG
ncbi:hypothetical protein M9434_003813 [Picochlorum sp. BPE23]|nr:hypothetical protein M9434_003813 [Picochlorum sp. BPE23]